MNAVLIAVALLGVHGFESQPPPRLPKESLTGVIESTTNPDRGLIFISIDEHADGTPDRGFLVELERRTEVFKDLKVRGTLHWSYQDSIELSIPQPGLAPLRVVFRSRSNTREWIPPLKSNDRVVFAVAMNRFKFVRPMPHAELAPLQLKRTLSLRLP